MQRVTDGSDWVFNFRDDNDDDDDNQGRDEGAVESSSPFPKTPPRTSCSTSSSEQYWSSEEDDTFASVEWPHSTVSPGMSVPSTCLTPISSGPRLHDSIDIGEVDEEHLNFVETPFTIASRLAAIRKRMQFKQDEIEGRCASDNSLRLPLQEGSSQMKKGEKTWRVKSPPTRLVSSSTSWNQSPSRPIVFLDKGGSRSSRVCIDFVPRPSTRVQTPSRSSPIADRSSGRKNDLALPNPRSTASRSLKSMQSLSKAGFNFSDSSKGLTKLSNFRLVEPTIDVSEEDAPLLGGLHDHPSSRIVPISDSVTSPFSKSKPHEPKTNVAPKMSPVDPTGDRTVMFSIPSLVKPDSSTGAEQSRVAFKPLEPYSEFKRRTTKSQSRHRTFLKPVPAESGENLGAEDLCDDFYHRIVPIARIRSLKSRSVQSLNTRSFGPASPM